MQRITNATLSIIIVNWNGRDLLARCIESIVNRPPSMPYEIVVVDNASTDGSVAWLRSAHSTGRLKVENLRLIENAENVGFGKANNMAFKQTNASMFLLLNTDIEVREGAIDRLVETLMSHEKVGGCGPKVLNADGSLRPTVCRQPPPVWEILMTGFKLQYLLPRRIRAGLLLGHHWDHSTRRTSSALSGSALLLRREVVDSVGGFDEEFYFYGEDIELCLRIVNSGWEILFEPEAQVIHEGSMSALQRWDSDEIHRRSVDGLFRCYRKWLPRSRFVAVCSASFLVSSVRRIWKRARGISTRDVDVAHGVHRKYLRECMLGMDRNG